uniref:Uncharacterized protein n=1 Tax=Anguilla anguilla TaxID=7936 RepID=A0A0E9UW30_ANGAN
MRFSKPETEKLLSHSSDLNPTEHVSFSGEKTANSPQIKQELKITAVHAWQSTNREDSWGCLWVTDFKQPLHAKDMLQKYKT